MYSAKYLFPILGQPNVCIYVTSLFIFLFISIADIVAKAAPKLCPVTVALAFGYFLTNPYMM
jgi:hypothetical protein